MTDELVQQEQPVVAAPEQSTQQIEETTTTEPVNETTTVEEPVQQIPVGTTAVTTESSAQSLEGIINGDDVQGNFTKEQPQTSNNPVEADCKDGEYIMQPSGTTYIKPTEDKPYTAFEDRTKPSL